MPSTNKGDQPSNISVELIGTKQEFIGYLIERRADALRQAEYTHITQKEQRYLRGVAAGIEFAIEAVKDWTVTS